MKFIHISDLHLGKSIHGVSLIDQKDQSVWVDHFLELCQNQKPDAVLIAGDVYDRSSPSADAVMLLDHLLTGLSDLTIPVMMIAGNHDSGEKLSFANALLSKQNLHICGVLDAELPHLTLHDEYGPVHFWLMPYLFPTLVAQKLEDDSIRDYDTAVRALLSRQNICTEERNVLIAHQNVTANGVEVERGGSETMVGGVGQIDYTAFDFFDYVALGHIHNSYPVGRPEVRYAGSPLYYHFDELRQKEKGPLLIEIAAKGEKIQIQSLPVTPLHPMREIKDCWANVQNMIENDKRKNEYLRIVLTDCKITPQISSYLRDMTLARGSILMELVSEHHEYQSVEGHRSSEDIAEQPIEALFEEFYIQRKASASPTSEESAILLETAEITRKAMIDGKSSPDEKEIQALLDYVLNQEA